MVDPSDRTQLHLSNKSFNVREDKGLRFTLQIEKSMQFDYKKRRKFTVKCFLLFITNNLGFKNPLLNFFGLANKK